METKQRWKWIVRCWDCTGREVLVQKEEPVECGYCHSKNIFASGPFET